MIETINYQVTDMVKKLGFQQIPIFRIPHRVNSLASHHFLKFEPIINQDLLRDALKVSPIYYEDPDYDYPEFIDERYEHLQTVYLEIINSLELDSIFEFYTRLRVDDLAIRSFISIDYDIVKVFSGWMRDMITLKKEAIAFIELIAADDWQQLSCIKITIPFSNLNQPEEYTHYETSFFIIINRETCEIWLVVFNLFLEELT